VNIPVLERGYAAYIENIQNFGSEWSQAAYLPRTNLARPIRVAKTRGNAMWRTS